jgi:uncharacterized protein
MSTALITGATSGIGAEFARQVAGQGHDLVLVARDTDRLEATSRQLRSTYGVDCEVLVADLVTADGIGTVEQRLADAGRPVDLLVSSAGFGLRTPFLRSSVDDEESILRIHVLAVLRLTHAALRGMVARGRGAVINVSSIAGFLSGGTYSAAKAWVTTFSEGLQHEIDGTGVQVMALCPGYVHTELHQRMGIREPGPSWAWMDVQDVVSAALRDLRRGKVISVPGAHYKALATLADLMPRAALRRSATRIRRR